MASFKKINKNEKQIMEILNKLDTDTEEVWEVENDNQNYQIKLNTNSENKNISVKKGLFVKEFNLSIENDKKNYVIGENFIFEIDCFIYNYLNDNSIAVFDMDGYKYQSKDNILSFSEEDKTYNYNSTSKKFYVIQDGETTDFKDILSSLYKRYNKVMDAKINLKVDVPFHELNDFFEKINQEKETLDEIKERLLVVQEKIEKNQKQNNFTNEDLKFVYNFIKKQLQNKNLIKVKSTKK